MSLNRQHLEERGGDQQLDSRITAMETAFRMQFAATEAFDLNREPQHIREEYGSTHFAKWLSAGTPAGRAWSPFHSSVLW